MVVKQGFLLVLGGVGGHSKGRLAKTFLGNCIGMQQNAGLGDLGSPHSPLSPSLWESITEGPWSGGGGS